MRSLLRVASYRFRATFGRCWLGNATIILLIGLVGGLAMGSIAGARRTQSALLLANLVAALPGRIAGRTPTALILRAE
jgi:hypothetical protein